jgi:energy-coupling factor transporter ATP-binding protein EcfA2
MRPDLGREPWDRPYYWWGPPWAAPNPRTLDDLVTQGMLSGEQASWLTRHVRNGGSLVVAALRSGTGKSTVAHTLIDVLPPERPRIYLRGQAETFEWVRPVPAHSATLLVNEISDHLPVYCWGQCARRVLDLAAKGYQVIATVHADRPEALIALLRSPEIEASDAEIVALDIVVFLDITPRGERMITAIARLMIDADTNRPVARPVEFGD